MKNHNMDRQGGDIENKSTDQLLHDHSILFNLILSYGVHIADLNHMLEVERELSIREEQP